VRGRPEQDGTDVGGLAASRGRNGMDQGRRRCAGWHGQPAGQPCCGSRSEDLSCPAAVTRPTVETPAALGRLDGTHDDREWFAHQPAQAAAAGEGEQDDGETDDRHRRPGPPRPERLRPLAPAQRAGRGEVAFARLVPEEARCRSEGPEGHRGVAVLCDELVRPGRPDAHDDGFGPVGGGRQLEKTAAVGPVRRRLAGRAVRPGQVETAGGGRRERRALMEEVSRVEDAHDVGVPGDLRRAACHEALGGTGEGFQGQRHQPQLLRRHPDEDETPGGARGVGQPSRPPGAEVPGVREEHRRRAVGGGGLQGADGTHDLDVDPLVA